MHAQMLNSRCSKKGQHGPTATASELSPKPRPPPAVAMTRCVAPFVPIPFSRSETLVTLTFTTALRPHSPHVNTILNILNHSLFALSFLGHHLIVLVSRCFKHVSSGTCRPSVHFVGLPCHQSYVGDGRLSLLSELATFRFFRFFGIVDDEEEEELLLDVEISSRSKRSYDGDRRAFLVSSQRGRMGQAFD